VLKTVAAEFEGPFFPMKKWLFKRRMSFARWRAKRGQQQA